MMEPRRAFRKYKPGFLIRHWSISLLCSWLAVRCASPTDDPPESQESMPVNILLMTVDNLGYGDLQVFNENSPIKTPHIERLARQGARLTSFYSASPTCTVSRACLLTGRIPQRHKLDYQLPGIEGNWGIGLRQSETLIPEIIKTSPHAYATGAFGKWNIGFAPGSRPTERGFDEFLGFASGNIDYYHHVYNGKHDLYHNTQEIDRDGEYVSDLFAGAAIDFISKNTEAANPWFVYLPFNAPHFPNPRNKAPGQPTVWQAPDAALAAYDLSPDEADPKKRYHAVVTAVDEAIGRVLNTLDSLGIADHTFVFLYSDNGAFMLEDRGLEVSTNAPLREGGVTCWEGGVRVAALARWPGKIPANSVIDVPLWSPDLLVASAALAGAHIPDSIVLDGKNPLPVLTGETDISPHETFYFEYQEHAALRWKDWKVVRPQSDQRWQLFNLAEDIGEENDLAGRYPEVVEKLSTQYTRMHQELAEAP
ncbi:MAG: sulfatase-like hydrolase/transferase [Cyclobacteriaceae bacterium]